MVENDESVEHGDIPMSNEYRAYKAILATALALHTQEYVNVCSKLDKVLGRFKSLKTITIELQERIRIIKNKVSSQTVKINAYRRLFQDLLQNDDDLSLMNLTLLKDKPHLYRYEARLEGVYRLLFSHSVLLVRVCSGYRCAYSNIHIDM
jgi:hypothetical protein